MNDIIYPNNEAARHAVIEYIQKQIELMASFGVWEENGDSCTTPYVYAKYFDESLQVKTYCA